MLSCYFSYFTPRPTVDGRRKRRNEAEPEGKKNKRERSGDKGDGVREGKEKKFPWQADEQVDEGQSGRDTNDEHEGKTGKNGRYRTRLLCKEDVLFFLARFP